MLSGFNTNVRHRGVLFHVQTEDSGRAHPHVITHLYHAGTILASEKRGYGDRVDQPDLAGGVKGLMESQHAAMLERLRGGDLDEVIAERLGPEIFGGATTGTSGHTQPAGAPVARTPAAAGPTQSEPGPRRGADPDPGASQDRPLDELILDYLVEATRQRRVRPE